MRMVSKGMNHPFPVRGQLEIEATAPRIFMPLPRAESPLGCQVETTIRCGRCPDGEIQGLISWSGAPVVPWVAMVDFLHRFPAVGKSPLEHEQVVVIPGVGDPVPACETERLGVTGEDGRRECGRWRPLGQREGRPKRRAGTEGKDDQEKKDAESLHRKASFRFW